jgi:uncharacterized protein YjiS (DUF1127 family)
MSWKHLLSTLHEWHLRARTRRQISTLDARTMADLGVAPSQLAFEAQKPFWRQ